MTHQISCDVCGKAPAWTFHVDVWAEGVAVAEKPTGVRQTKDLCAECRISVSGQMLEAAVTQLTRDIPRHQVMVAARAEESQALAALETATRQLLLAQGVGDVAAAKRHQHELDQARFAVASAQAKFQEAFVGGPITEG